MLIGVVFFTVMTTWHTGARLLAERVARSAPDMTTFLGRITSEPPQRVPGTAIFFTGRLEQTPPALLQLLRHTGTLHERVLLLTVVVEPVAKTNAEERIELTELGNGFYRVVLHYGFMQRPNIPSELAACASLGLNIDTGAIHYFIGQIDLFEGARRGGMSPWRDHLFIFMARNTEDATAYYQIPAAQAMNVGSQIGI